MKRKLSILILLLLLTFVVSCGQKSAKSTESSISKMGNIEKIKITASAVDVKTGCSNDTSTMQTYPKNNTLDVVNSVGDWFAVKLPNNKIGFVPKNQCKPVVVDDTKTDMKSGAASLAPQTTGGNTVAGSPVAKTPTANTSSSTLTAQEKEMLRLVNEARAKNNVAPLSIDMELTNVARIKSQDMIDNKYFSHYSPKYGSPFDMMKSFGIKYVKAGENIAGNQSVQNAHNSLMNSPGHRKNILSPDYTHIGIGIKKGGTYGNMFTQMFISKPK